MTGEERGRRGPGRRGEGGSGKEARGEDGVREHRDSARPRALRSSKAREVDGRCHRMSSRGRTKSTM